ncbi:MAG TPA: hypothetical protein VIC35_11715 [Acidimicrobiia bacterium]|jgi:hypothetical protein
MAAETARKCWRTLEPIHGMIYFAPEGPEEYGKVGITNARAGYFASRSAAMGAVSAETVIATFFNFNPALVRKSVPSCWGAAEPRQVLDARLRAADRALHRLLGEALSSDEVREAAELARSAATAPGMSMSGRPLYAAHTALPWPGEPHLVLWHAITILREFRGDGHVAALVDDGVSGIEALVMHAASGDVPADLLRATRAWSDDEWGVAVAELHDRGWVDEDGRFTETGHAHRAAVEQRTDELAAAPWEHLGEARCQRLRELCRPLSRAIVGSGTFGAR